MKLLFSLLILLVLTAPSLGGYVVVLEEEQPVIDLESLFAPDRQSEFIDQEGLISFGPEDRYQYSVYEEYTVEERLRIYQECQKWLYYQDKETLLYMYQYVVLPYPFPLAEFPLAQEMPVAVDVPGAVFLLMIGVIAISVRRLRYV